MTKICGSFRPALAVEGRTRPEQDESMCSSSHAQYRRNCTCSKHAFSRSQLLRFGNSRDSPANAMCYYGEVVVFGV